MEIRPQPGPQEQFLATSADICIYGGSAGGGKTWGLLAEPLRHHDNGKFGAVIFRRNSVHVRAEGGLWDASEEIYPYFGARGSPHTLVWRFPSGMKVSFGHLDRDQDRFNWKGTQIPLLGFDELTDFSEKQFFYLMSRNRSESGVSGYIRATTNPDPDSWVSRFIAWWIDWQTGLPIHDRAGVLRWFVRSGDDFVWGDNREELVAKHGPDADPKSVTFIPASVYDNKILLEKDPAYLSNLKALPRVEREQLLGGNWLIRPAAGMYFKREYFEVVDAAPSDGQRIRYWDRAATPETGTNDPDWTVGLRVSRDNQGIFYVEDMVRFRASPHRVEKAIVNTAGQDGKPVKIGIEEDPGQAGKAEASYYVRALVGYDVRTHPVMKDKVTRASPMSAQAEAGNVKIVRGPWNEAFFRELENFPEGSHDDIVDALSGAGRVLTDTQKVILV